MSKRSVSIRMYRQGLGDCFLLTLPREDGTPFFILVDCGALNSKHYGKERMIQVVQDIWQTTRGKLDVVAVSHEHWDHISGFLQAEELFTQRFAVGSVWTAWTEDMSRPEIAALKQRFKKKKQVVAMAMDRIPDAIKDERLGLYKRAIGDLFGFFGGLGASGAGNTERAWNIALGLGTNVHLDPKDDPLELTDVPGVRVYCLGPPADPELVKRKLSSKETYHETFASSMALADSFHAALNEPQEPTDAGRAKPFDSRYQISKAEARQNPACVPKYAFEETASDYWRSIEHDWLMSAGELALHLDSYTNNTCMAFAIELGDSGKVLLFPGDAQVGNWLSWESLTWRVPDPKRPGRRKTVTSMDLLARTVFYKVGHHGSHNATMKGKGLEKMQSEDLIAMIPVHRKTAKDQAWEFPYGPLWKRLKEKAKGRVLLADAESLQEIESDLAGLDEQKRKEFERATRHEPLYVECKIDL